MKQQYFQGLQELINKTGKFEIIGHDGICMRMGWVDHQPWELIESGLKKFDEKTSPPAGGYDNFIFSAMGGSINAIKALKKIYNAQNIYTIDSLDPRAQAELEGLKNVMVVAISKSGTTKETLTLAQRLNKPTIWLKDKDGDLPIQFDGGNDIGGRYSAPETMVFWAPLFLIMNRDLNKLKEIHTKFGERREEIIEKMWTKGQELAEKKCQYFNIDVNPALETWVTQLFEESLGLKIDGYYPKTLVNHPPVGGFEMIKLSEDTMEAMFEAQVCVASIAYSLGIVFVNQPSVEKYKGIMRGDRFVQDIKVEVRPYKFVEVVNYGYMNDDPPAGGEREQLKKEYQAKYPDKIVLVFEGSDWNHHSYQAAYGNPETLFILIDRGTDPILTQIVNATYETLKDRAILV